MRPIGGGTTLHTPSKQTAWQREAKPPESQQRLPHGVVSFATPQTPVFSPVFASVQAAHAPAQALLQQTPSAQLPVVQSAPPRAPAHASPCSCLGRHWPS